MGGWLTIDGVAVDWIYRDLNRNLGRRDSLGAAVDAAEQLVADVSRRCRR